MPGKPWYAEGLRFSCKKCGGCCGGFPGYVWMNEAEMSAIAAHVGMERAEFRAAYARRVGGRYTLREVENYNCVMLGPEGCRVYPVRPTQCRTFPFWEENLSRERYWQSSARDCPGMNEGRKWTLEEIESRRCERSFED